MSMGIGDHIVRGFRLQKDKVWNEAEACNFAESVCIITRDLVAGLRDDGFEASYPRVSVRETEGMRYVAVEVVVLEKGTEVTLGEWAGW
jgi:hypothetical protein